MRANNVILMRIILLWVCVVVSSVAEGIVDNNSNGMSDLWEKKFHAESLNPALDEDNDLQSNLAESIAGTNPFDDQSVISISNVNIVPSALFVSWDTTSQIRYQLESSTSLSGASWVKEGVEIEGNGSVVSVVASKAGASKKFFRVSIMSSINENVLERARLIQGDTDGDGSSDIDEWVNGVNPIAASSVLLSPRVKSGPIVEITWNTEKGKRYQLRSRLQSSGSAWQDEGVPYTGTGRALIASLMLTDLSLVKEYSVIAFDTDSDLDGLSDWEEMQIGFDHLSPSSDILGENDLVAVNALLTGQSKLSVQAENCVANVTRNENGEIVVIREGGLDELNVTYSVSGTAMPNDDYVALSGSLNMPFGMNRVVIPIVPNLNTSITLSRSVVVSLGSSEDYTLGVSSSQQINIIRESAINVKDHGAVGDGITDDTAAVQLALDELAQSTGKNALYFPLGQYRLNSTTINYDTSTSIYRILYFGGSDMAGRDIVVYGDTGASLFSTVSPERAHMLMVSATFRSLSFYGMTWQKDGVPLRERVGVEPNGADGVSVVVEDEREIESITFNGCTFINCHGAVHTYGTGRDIRGKLRHFGMYNSSILNPFGANTVNSASSWGGGQQVKIWPWIKNAEYIGNVFDGGSDDMTDATTMPGGRVKDGCHFGCPVNLIFHDNLVNRMGVEAILQTNDISGMGSTAGSFVIPPADNTTTTTVSVSNGKNTFVSNQIINIRTPFVPGVSASNNIFRVVAFDVINRVLTIVNIGSPLSLPPGTQLDAGRKIYLQYADPSTAVITDNIVDGTVPPGGRVFAENSGIVSLAKSLIRGNVIINYWAGIHMYNEVKTPLSPAGRGSIIDSNIVLTRDAAQLSNNYTYGVLLYPGSEMVTDNLIVSPVSRKVAGIMIKGNASLIRSNYSIARDLNKAGLLSYSRSVGIAVDSLSSDVIIRDNHTYGHDIGVSPFIPYIWVDHEVHNHSSSNDTLPVHASGLQHLN